MSDLRVGIVGAGLIGGVHSRAYAATAGTRVVVVADPVRDKADRLAAAVGAEASTYLEMITRDDLDIVSICTPPMTHAALAVQALEAGLNVLCEKPIARTLEDAELIVQASRRAKRLLMIGHVIRFEADHHQAKQVVDAGQLGEVTMMSHSITTSMPAWSEAGWLSDIGLSGGPLVDLAIHSFDYLSWVASSEAVRVHAVGADTAAGRTTYALSQVRYANGAIALVESSWGHPPSHGFKVATEIIGTEGRLSWDYDRIGGGYLHSFQGETVRLDPLGESGFVAEIGQFTDAVRAGAPSPVTAEDGLAALRTSLAALESVRTGATVDLRAWGSS